MSNWTRIVSSIAALGLLVGLAGCTGTTTAGADDGRNDPGDETTPPGARLTHVSPCNPSVINEDMNLYEPCVAEDVTHNSSVTLKAKLVNGSGQPIGDKRVYFGIINDETTSKVQQAGHPSFSPSDVPDRADGISLGTKSAATGEDGVASVELFAGSSSGIAPVVAWIKPEETSGDSADANFLRWQVPVSSKSQGNFAVRVIHKGMAEVTDVEVKLFSSDHSCDDIRTQFRTRRSSPGSFQPPPSEVRRDGTLRQTDGRTTISFTELKRNTEFTVLARAFGTANPGIEKAIGCAESDAVEGGGTTEVDVPVYDHVPIMQDSYSVTHRFNLTDALPEDVQDYVQLVGMFTKSPSSLLLGCEQGDKGVNGQDLCPNGDVEGVLVRLLKTDILDGLPIDASDVETVVNSIVGDSIRTALDQEIFDLIEGTAVGSGVQVTQDIYDTITRFGVRGEFEFSGNPQPTLVESEGRMKLVFENGGATQRWSEFAFFNTQGGNCSSSSDFNQCRTNWINIGQLIDSGAGIEGDFKATVKGLHNLKIHNHNLNIYFGSLLIGAIEHVVLPRYFSNTGSGNTVANLDKGCQGCQSGSGDGIVSFEEVFANTLADCSQLANSVGSDGDTLHTTFENVCSDLRGRLIDRAKEEIINRLTVDGDGVFSMNTPSGTPCTMYEPANYDNAPDTYDPLPFIKRLGQEADGSRCPWNVTLEFSGSANDVGGTFYSTP